MKPGEAASIFFICVLLIGFSMAVWDTSRQSYWDKHTIEEIEVLVRPRIFMCPCMKSFGHAQEHIDCHYRKDI